VNENQVETPKMRVRVGMPDLDGAARGARGIAAALREGGLEVIFSGQHESVSALAASAIQEGVDAIVLSLLSGAHASICARLRGELAARGAGIPIVVSGDIPAADIPALRADGVHAVFESATPFETLVDAVRALARSQAPVQDAHDAHIRATRLDHTALVVKDLDATIALFEELLGARCAHREVVAAQKVSAAFFDFPNGASLELVSPEASLGGNAGLEKFLAKRGDGLHHLALRVNDLDALLLRLAAKGVPLLDTVSRAGARGHKVAFLHPKALNGTLLELVEAHE